MISRRSIIFAVLVLLLSLPVGARFFGISVACGDAREQLMSAQARESGLPAGDVPCGIGAAGWSLRIVEIAFVACVVGLVGSALLDARARRFARSSSGESV